jgi:threonine synthase
MPPTLKCTICGAQYAGFDQTTCATCGRWGILEVLTPAGVGPSAGPDAGVGIRRFLPMLPIPDGAPLPAPPVGDTPLVDAPRLAAALGLTSLRLKDDGRNPSGSYKDRASWVAAALAGGRTAACASTGNAASSLAAMCAAVGSPAMIFVPRRAPAPKLAQLQVFGATVFRVDGTYDEAYELCARAIEALGWYDRNAAVNPYMVEGKKTCGLELAEALAQAPAEWVAVSVGDGCTLAGIWKGLKEMHALGALPTLPRILGVQAAGSPAIFREWMDGGDEGPARAPREAGADTVADSICVGVPRNWRRAVRAVDESGGRIVLVKDDEIDEAMRQTARLGGVYGEPAAAASVAGLRRAVKDGAVSGSAVAVITGSGLKDVAGARRAGGDPIEVAADLGAVLEALASREG